MLEEALNDDILEKKTEPDAGEIHIE